MQSLIRAQRLFTHGAAFPWFLFAWGAADVLGRIEFISKYLDRIRASLMSQAGGVIILFTGVLLLIFIVVWPDVKKKFLWLTVKTAEERIELLEGQSNDWVNASTRILGLLEALKGSDSQTMKYATQTSTRLYEEISDSSDRFNALEKRTQGELNSLKTQISEFNGLFKKFPDAMQGTALILNPAVEKRRQAHLGV